MMRTLLSGILLVLVSFLPAANAGGDAAVELPMDATCGGILDANCQHTHSCGTGCTITYTCIVYIALGSNHPSGLTPCYHNI